LTQPDNLVGTLGPFSTTAGFALVNNQTLLVVGSIKDSGTASTLALTTKTGDIDLAGRVSAANIVDLVSAGAIGQSGGTLAADTLAGSAVGAASLTANNQIAKLGNFSAGNLVLNDAVDLLIGGTLNAAGVAVRAPTSQITLGDGASIVTSGSVRPPGPTGTGQRRARGLFPGCRLHPGRQQQRGRPGRRASDFADSGDGKYAV
jgi:hypothetical protein